MNKHRKLALAVLASITIAGIAGASASSLGGINTAGIGADTTVTASCDIDGVNTSYGTSYNATTGGFDVSSVTFSGVATACNGKTATVVLADATKVSLANGSSAITLTNVVSGSGEFTLALNAGADAKATRNISLVIQG
jgi:hypothetical protein